MVRYRLAARRRCIEQGCSLVVTPRMLFHAKQSFLNTAHAHAVFTPVLHAVVQSMVIRGFCSRTRAKQSLGGIKGEDDDGLLVLAHTDFPQSHTMTNLLAANRDTRIHSDLGREIAISTNTADELADLRGARDLHLLNQAQA
jgi:hypothetical protein